MRKFFEKLCDGVVKEWGMIVALVLLSMPPMLFSYVFLGGVHSGVVNGFSVKLWEDQLMYPLIDMGILLFEVIITAIVVRLIDRKWFKWLVYGLYIALATVRIWLWWVFGMRISPQAFQLLMETNSQESAEFIQVYLIGWYGIGLIGIILGLVGLCLLFEWMGGKLVLEGVWKKVVIGVCAICLMWGAVEMRWMVRLAKCEVSEDVFVLLDDLEFDCYDYGASNNQAILFAITGYYSQLADTKFCKEVADEAFNRRDEMSCDNDSLLIVFVLGESYIKSHCGLYGYERNTTPLLTKEKDSGNLYVFNDVVSPYTKTSEVVKSVFFTNNLSEKWYKSVFFLQLYKMLGFQVDFWTNQVFNVEKKWLFFDSSNILFDKDIIAYSYSKTSSAFFKYDGELIDDYFSKTTSFDHNRFVVFHLKGNHFDVSERFPQTKENMVYCGTDERSNKIAFYDNACVYNDKVLAKLLDQIKDKKSVVVYFSDHGEEVYDYRDCYGRMSVESGMEKEFLKYQAEVPFMIWCSDKYKEAYPEIIEDIERSVDKPFVTDNVCQVMFHLAGLKSPWYKEERDLLSGKYKCEKRVVNEMFDYDEVMNRK